MKKFLVLLCIVVATLQGNAQAKGTKIGYINMDYILENVPDYKEASIQLEQKAQKWKQDIELKKNEIIKLKEALKTESALLTKELVNEREEEIKFLENELLDYQQKRFGPNGDLMIQKTSIVKPIQDQVFNAVQDIAEAKKYDFILDKSSNLTMLFSAKRYDISDQVLKVITRSEKKEEMSKKQLKALEEKEAKEDLVDEIPALAERKKILDGKKAARELILEERKQAVIQKKKEFDERRKKLQEEQKAKKTGTTIDTTSTNKVSVNMTKASDEKKVVLDSLKNKKETDRLKAIESNKKTLEERKKVLEDKKKKIIADREAAMKAKQDKK